MTISFDFKFKTIKVVMSWMQQLGEEIAKARRKAGKTQEDLHKAVGVSRQIIGKYEKGKIPPPFETLVSIATALSVEEFVVEGLHVTLSRNGKRAAPTPLPQQLALDFDKDGGATVRIEPTGVGLVIKVMSA
jgi:transcriptional regulator with XRE-family HTH domain